MIMYHLGPQLGVWIMQVSTFSRVLINRFHCISMILHAIVLVVTGLQRHPPPVAVKKPVSKPPPVAGNYINVLMYVLYST